MAKNFEISFLLDFYGEMLTDKQREVVKLYYNQDLSLAEIAQHSGITRQGVRDSIKRAENQLIDYEERLRLYSRFHKIRRGLDEIALCAEQLKEENQRLTYSEEFSSRCDRIIEIATGLND